MYWSIIKNRRTRIVVKPISSFLSLDFSRSVCLSVCLALVCSLPRSSLLFLAFEHQFSFCDRSIESTECLTSWLTENDSQRSSFSLPASPYSSALLLLLVLLLLQLLLRATIIIFLLLHRWLEYIFDLCLL